MSNEVRIAVVNIETGLVENIATVAPGDSSVADPGYALVPSDTADIGDAWDGKQIVKAPAPEAPVDAQPAPVADPVELPVQQISDNTARLDALEKRLAAVELKLGMGG